MSGIFDQVINYAPPSLLLGTVTYKGTWSAATNTPTLPNPPSSITNGNYYVVSAAGTQFSLSFNIGDWIISNGSAWEKVDNTDAVSSVFGRTGAVVGVSTDYSAVGITATAVGASSPSTGAFTTLSATTPLAVASGGTGVASSTGTTNVVLSGSPTITTPVIAQINDANGNATVRLTGITSATDYLEIKNGIGVGSPLHILAEGASANIGMHVQPKGTGLLTISDGVDFNKGIRFRSVSSAASAVTLIDAVSTAGRVITLPDATDTLVGKATTDTLTNKTLTSPTITGGALNGTLGATTPSTIAATTISATGTITSTVPADSVISSCTTGTTGFLYHILQNTSGVSIFGLNGSTNTLGGTNSSAYDTVIRGNNISFSANNGTATQARITSTGLAVTGTVTSSSHFIVGANSNVGFGGLYAAGIPTIGASNNNSINFYPTGSTNGLIASITATGAAITGTLSTTGQISTSATGNALNISTAGATALYQNIGNSAGNIELGAITTGEAYVASGGNKDLRFYRYGSLMASITSTGLGIGTTTPAASASSTATVEASGCLVVGGAINAHQTNRGVFQFGSNTTSIRSYGATAGTGLITFHTGGGGSSADTERMRIDSSGNVGIGTTTPSSQLTLSGYGNLEMLTGNASGFLTHLYTGGNGSDNLSISANFKRTSDTTGTVGNSLIGTAEINLLTAGSGDIGIIRFSTGTLNTVPEERMRISNIGTLLIGTTNTDPTFNRVNGTNITSGGRIYCRSTGAWDLGSENSAPIHIAFYTDNGSARVTAGSISSSGSTTTYGTSSDYRRKSNIKDLANSGTFIDALKPRTFDWETGDKGVGFIAHEFAEVSPTSVVGEKDAVDADGKPVYQSMQAGTSEVIANLVAELQSLRKRLAALESK